MTKVICSIGVFLGIKEVTFSVWNEERIRSGAFDVISELLIGGLTFSINGCVFIPPNDYVFIVTRPLGDEYDPNPRRHIAPLENRIDVLNVNILRERGVAEVILSIRIQGLNESAEKPILANVKVVFLAAILILRWILPSAAQDTIIVRDPVITFHIRDVANEEPPKRRRVHPLSFNRNLFIDDFEYAGSVIADFDVLKSSRELVDIPASAELIVGKNETDSGLHVRHVPVKRPFCPYAAVW